MSDTIIVDIDGTLCDDGLHAAHDLDPTNTPALIECCRNAQPKTALVDLVRELCWHYRVELITSRDERFRDITKLWLSQFQINYVRLTMRGLTDQAPDHEAKVIWAKMLDLTPGKVAFVLEDRQRVVDAWRAAGYTCLQVAPGAL